ncbi:MAG: hypothetical protein AB8B61_00090 [Cyclobacteriaceae bacterium]
MKRIINLIVFVGLLAGAYYGYQWWQQNQGSTSTLTLLHPEASIVISSNSLEKDYLTLNKRTAGNHLLDTKPFQDLTDFIQEVSPNFLVHEYTLNKLIKNKRAAISLHFSNTSVVDFIFYLSLSGKEKTLTLAALEQLGKQKDKQLEKQQKPNFDLYFFPSYGIYFTFVNNHLIASKSSSLLDDIQLYKETPTTLSNFFLNKGQSKGISTSKPWLYVNYKKLYEQLPTVFSKAPNNLKLLRSLAHFSIFSLSAEDHAFTMNGFTYGFSDRTNFLSIFNDQEMGDIDLKNMISNNTTTLVNIRLDDGLKLKKSLHKYWWDNDIPILNRWENLGENLTFELETFYSIIDNEIALSTLNSNNDQLLFISSRDGSLALRQLHQINGISSISVNEVYSDRKIYKSKIKDLPKLLFGDHFNGFNSSYYTNYKDIIIVSNSIQGLKVLINDLDQENVWGKSVKRIKELNSYMVEANFSYFMGCGNLKNDLSNKLNPSGMRELFSSSSITPIFKDFMIQWSSEENKHFTNVTLTTSASTYQASQSRNQKERIVSTPSVTETRPSLSTSNTSFTLTDKIASSPVFIHNHAENKQVMLVQDKKERLCMLTQSGKTLWSKGINNQILSTIHEVDMLNNKKIQYLFTTKNTIHCLDRLGREYDNFPLTLKNVKTIFPVDYEGNKDYRFLASSIHGDLYLFNKTGGKISSWFPKKIGTELLTEPRHIRIGKSDYFLAIQKKGKINLFRRTGKQANGFPVDVEHRLMDVYNYEIGATQSESFIRCMTHDGQYVKIDFTGKTTIQRFIPENITSEYVEMVATSDHKEYVYLFFKQNQLVVKNRFLKKLIDIPLKENTWSEKKLINHKGKKAIILYSDRQEKGVVLNLNSTTINQEKWVESSTCPLVEIKKNSLSIITTKANKLTIDSFR